MPFLCPAGGVGIVEDAVLLGAPVTGDENDWSRVMTAVAGRVVNGYCRSVHKLKPLNTKVARSIELPSNGHDAYHIYCFQPY